MFIWQALALEAEPTDAFLKKNWTALLEWIQAAEPAVREQIGDLSGLTNKKESRQILLEALLKEAPDTLPEVPGQDLKGWVEQCARRIFSNPRLAFDADAEICVRLGSAGVVLRINEDGGERPHFYPHLIILSTVASAIPPARAKQALQAAHELTNQWPCLKAVVVEDSIVLFTQIPLILLNWSSFRWAAQALSMVADGCDDQLAERLGTSTQFANYDEEFDV